MYPLTLVLGLATIVATVYSLQCYGGMSLSNGQPNPNNVINCLNFCRYKSCPPGDSRCIIGEYKCGDNICRPTDLNRYNQDERYCCNTPMCTPFNTDTYGSQYNSYQIGSGVSDTGTDLGNNGLPPDTQNDHYPIGSGVSGTGTDLGNNGLPPNNQNDPQRDNGISTCMYYIPITMLLSLYYSFII